MTTEIKTNLSAIEFVLVQRTGDETDITIYKDTEGWEFGNLFLAYELTGVTTISLKADADTVVQVYLGGS